MFDEAVVVVAVVVVDGGDGRNKRLVRDKRRDYRKENEGTGDGSNGDADEKTANVP